MNPRPISTSPASSKQRSGLDAVLQRGTGDLSELSDTGIWKGTEMSTNMSGTGNPVRQRIGPTIKNRRHQHEMSLNALADEAGISPSHLSRIERGLTVPSYDVLDRIADALGSDLSALRNEEEHALQVDVNLDEIFGQIGLDEEARRELLQLSHETREALAHALQRLASGRTRL